MSHLAHKERSGVSSNMKNKNRAENCIPAQEVYIPKSPRIRSLMNSIDNPQYTELTSKDITAMRLDEKSLNDSSSQKKQDSK